MTDGSDRLSNELHKSPSSRLEDLDSSLVDDEILDDLQKRQRGLVDDALSRCLGGKSQGGAGIAESSYEL